MVHEGRVPFQIDEDGYVFVDRSGEYFAVILQYLRTRQRPAEALLHQGLPPQDL